MGYTARFSKDPQESFIVAGGSFNSEGGGEAKVLSRGPGDIDTSVSHCIGTLVRYTCLSADFANSGSGLLATGGMDGRIRVMRIAANDGGTAQSSSGYARNSG